MPRYKSGGGINCVAFGCENYYAKTKGHGISYYRIPEDTSQQDKWIQALKRLRGDGTPYKPSKYAYVCSEHFVTGMKIKSD